MERMSRFRLYPTAEQEVSLLEVCAHARYVWNLGLEQRLMWRRWQGPTPSLNEQSRQLTEARSENEWLADGPAVVQQQALRDLARAWDDYFAGLRGKPSWRKERRHEGFRVVGWSARRTRQDNSRWSSILVPKVGWVRIRRSRALPDAKSYRVTRDRAGRWHIAFAAVPDSIPAPGTGEIVGLDRGVTVAMALSTGEASSPSSMSRMARERFMRLQRRLTRSTPGSRRSERLRLLIARAYAREADRRKDWVEKTSTDLARRFDVIHVENLHVIPMMRRGPGKRRINRGIKDNAWAPLIVRLEHKAPGRVEKINPAYTSQTCNACKHVDPKSRKSQARFVCTSCGHRANADVNAACNIRDKEPAAGLAVAARGDRAKSARSVKREPGLGRTAA